MKQIQWLVVENGICDGILKNSEDLQKLSQEKNKDPLSLMFCGTGEEPIFADWKSDVEKLHQKEVPEPRMVQQARFAKPLSIFEHDEGMLLQCTSNMETDRVEMLKTTVRSSTEFGIPKLSQITIEKPALPISLKNQQLDLKEHHTPPKNRKAWVSLLSIAFLVCGTALYFPFEKSSQFLSRVMEGEPQPQKLIELTTTHKQELALALTGIWNDKPVEWESAFTRFSEIFPKQTKETKNSSALLFFSQIDASGKILSMKESLNSSEFDQGLFFKAQTGLPEVSGANTLLDWASEILVWKKWKKSNSAQEFLTENSKKCEGVQSPFCSRVNWTKALTTEERIALLPQISQFYGFKIALNSARTIYLQGLAENADFEAIKQQIKVYISELGTDSTIEFMFELASREEN